MGFFLVEGEYVPSFEISFIYQLIMETYLYYFCVFPLVLNFVFLKTWGINGSRIWILVGYMLMKIRLAINWS